MTRRSASASNLELNAARWHIVDDFYDGADGLRAVAEQHFADYDKHFAVPGTWDLFVVDGQYAYLRATADRLIEPALVRAHRAAVSAWGWRNLGMGRLTDTVLALYLGGCGQGLHNDSAHGLHAFIHSLSPAHGFTGGETLLLRTEPYWGTTRTGRPEAGSSLLEKVAPTFNRLLVFDSRLIHGVETVHGSWSPAHGRLVLQGQFRPGGLHLTGKLEYADVTVALEEVGRRLDARVPELRTSVRAALGVRVDVSPGGEVEAVSVLSDWVVPLTDAGVPSGLISQVVDMLAQTRFTGGPGSATFTIPLDDLSPVAARYRKAGGLVLAEMSTGFDVTDLSGRQHRLNPSATFILECCTGEADEEDIARQVQDAFSLASPPQALVDQCLHELLTAGLITA